MVARDVRIRRSPRFRAEFSRASLRKGCALSILRSDRGVSCGVGDLTIFDLAARCTYGVCDRSLIDDTGIISYLIGDLSSSRIGDFVGSIVNDIFTYDAYCATIGSDSNIFIPLLNDSRGRAITYSRSDAVLLLANK